MARTIQQISFPAPMRPSLKRVAAYARVSSGKDAMLHSLSAQVSYYSALIQKHTGWLYCGVYADEAFTGTKDSRDGFQSLLAECRAGNLGLLSRVRVGIALSVRKPCRHSHKKQDRQQNRKRTE
mgnify:CR=1 FL=1